MKKEEPSVETVGMTAFDYPNGQHLGYENKMYYGNQHVPHPTNSAAKRVDAAKVMRQVREGK